MKSSKRKKSVFIFAFSLLFALAIQINVMAQHVRLKWVNFSPYTVRGQNPDHQTPIPTSQIHELLDSLVIYVEGIRIFGTDDPLDSIPYFAKQKGLKVIVGIWLQRENSAAHKAGNIAQINKGIAIANAGLADKIIVGSEVLYRGDLPADTLIQYIRQVKAACPNIPVSCADVYSSLIANPGVISACDFISPNIYPFWEGVPIECGMQRFHQIYLSLLPHANGKEIFISESGWKTFGNSTGAAVPSLPNAIRYNRGLLTWSHVFGVDVNIFMAFDEPYKQEKNDDGWGIFSNDAILKPGMDTLFKPFTNIDSVWLCTKLNNSGSDTLLVDYVPLIGSLSSIKGRVDNIIPCDYRIATYIKVAGGWWTKPFFHEPAVQILCDGTWNVKYATGGNDNLATDICVFLVPSAYSPPLCGGCANIPDEVYQNAIEWKCINRATIAATLTASRDTICFGDSVTLTATGGTRYLWNTGDSTSSIIVAPQFYTDYTVEISISPGVGAILSKTIAVDPAPTINSTPAFQTVCSGTAISQINILTGTTFAWTRDNTTNLTGIASNGTGAAIAGILTNVTGTLQTTTFTITTTAGGCSSLSTAIVTVKPSPTINTTPGSQTVCSETAISQINNINSNNVSGTTFTWTRDNTTGLTGIASNGIGATIVGTLTNTSNAPQTTTFTITATAGGCSSSTTATVAVNPKPPVSSSPGSQTVCSGIAISQINISTGTTFTWVRNNTTDLTGIASNGTGATIAGILTNATNAPKTTTFTITATANGCSSSTNAAVTVNPKPTVSSAPAIQTVCSGVTINQISNNNPNNVSGTIFTWTRDKTAELTGLASGTGVTIAGPLVNTTNIPQTTTFTIKATANGCADSTEAKVTVNPLPTVGLTASPFTSLLPGQTTTLTATPGASKGGTITTWWLYNANPIFAVGNFYFVDVEKVGSYQVLIQETWPGNIVCHNQSPVVAIDATVSDRLFIFPSPNDGLFNVFYYSTGPNSSRFITIYDSKGSKKYDAKYEIRGPYTRLGVDMRPLQRGIYFVVVRDRDGKKLAAGKVTVN